MDTYIAVTSFSTSIIGSERGVFLLDFCLDFFNIDLVLCSAFNFDFFDFEWDLDFDRLWDRDRDRFLEDFDLDLERRRTFLDDLWDRCLERELDLLDLDCDLLWRDFEPERRDCDLERFGLFDRYGEGDRARVLCLTGDILVNKNKMQ